MSGSHSKALTSDRSLDSLYREHAVWLQGWLRYRLGSHADAADLVQDTYVRLLRSDCALDSIKEPRALLVQIAKGLAVDMHRRRRLEQSYLQALATLPEPDMPSPELSMLLLETLTRVDQALDALSHRARTAFLLSRFEGMTYSDIASRLGVSVASVRKYMLQAVSACHDAMGDMPDGV